MLSICLKLNNESSESIRGVDSRTKKPRTNGRMYVVNFDLNGRMYTPYLYIRPFCVITSYIEPIYSGNFVHTARICIYIYIYIYQGGAISTLLGKMEDYLHTFGAKGGEKFFLPLFCISKEVLQKKICEMQYYFSQMATQYWMQFGTYT